MHNMTFDWNDVVCLILLGVALPWVYGAFCSKGPPLWLGRVGCAIVALDCAHNAISYAQSVVGK